MRNAVSGMLTPATRSQTKIGGKVELERPLHHTKDFLGDNPKTNSKIPEKFHKLFR